MKNEQLYNLYKQLIDQSFYYEYFFEIVFIPWI